jgi:hypothetical protein
MNRGNFFKLTASGIAIPALEPVRRFWALGGEARDLDYWDIQMTLQRSGEISFASAMRVFERDAPYKADGSTPELAAQISKAAAWYGGPPWGQAPIRVNIGW